MSKALKRALEGAFPAVRVRGEISGFTRAGSGHLYFSLKDADAVLDGVCWRGSAARLGLMPEDGMEVVVTGRITSYAPRSRYQIVVERMELAGEGALLKLLDDRRRKLAAEGLFDEDAKRKIPFLPEIIGVVTSPTGAVIRDILHRLEDRFPRRVLIWPVLVQGEAAADQVAAAIKGFNALVPGGKVPRPDVLIVARGGGSLEDLMAFNEEKVVRAAAASDIPLISAVGHETDTTLIDLAADVRAPTPTAAAEMAVPVRVDLVAGVMDAGGRMASAVSRLLGERRTHLAGLARGLPDLGRLLGEVSQRLDDWAERLKNSLRVGIVGRRSELRELAARLPHPRQRLALAESRLQAQGASLARAGGATLKDRRAELRHAGSLLKSYSYKGVLERGFALIRDGNDQPVVSVKETSPGQDLTVQFKDGKAPVTVTDKHSPGAKKPPGNPKAKPPGRENGRQGKLL